MPLTEKDPGALNRLRMRVRALGSPVARAELHQVLAAGATTELQNGFVNSVDPYGKEWEALKSRDGQPLRKNGHMAASAHTNQKPDGFSITLDQGHPKTHQDGKTIYPVSAAALSFFVRGKRVFAKVVTIPQRMMFPVARRGLGNWGPTLKRDASNFLRRLLTGRQS
jgi:hypothetical protein